MLVQQRLAVENIDYLAQSKATQQELHNISEINVPSVKKYCQGKEEMK
jgi:hypothetical protein